MLPIIFVTIWAVMMETEMTTHDSLDCLASSLSTPDSCWTGWSDSPYLFYLIAAPMLVAYAVSYLIFTSLNFLASLSILYNFFSSTVMSEKIIKRFHLDQSHISTEHCEDTCL